MPYLALKPCKFCDNHYLVNDIIPDEAVNPAVVRVLEDAGVIKHIPTQSAGLTGAGASESGKEDDQSGKPPEDNKKKSTDSKKKAG